MDLTPPGPPTKLLGCVLYSVAIGFMLCLSLFVALLVICSGNFWSP
jgi:hypothetical protein